MGVRDALGVLGLAARADAGQLRGAYLAAVKMAHPDKPGGDAERLRRVVEAYEFLKASGPAPSSQRPVPRPPRPATKPLEITPVEAVLGGLRQVTLEGVGETSVRLPPGLRVGDLVAVSGVAMTVSISAADGAAVVGDHLCLTVRVDQAVIVDGGSIEVSTPTGTLRVRVTRQEAARGLVRVADGGLPPRGRHGQGHLFIRLAAASSAPYETRSRYLLRRFVAAWAA